MDDTPEIRADLAARREVAVLSPIVSGVGFFWGAGGLGGCMCVCINK